MRSPPLLLAHRGAGGLLAIPVIVAWAALWYANVLWSRSQSLPDMLASLTGKGVPLVFGLTLLFLWEVACVGLNVPSVLLPAPSLILHKLLSSLPQLGADFVQTFVRAALPGWLIGSAAGFAAALACDRYDFLRRGLLPIGNFVSAPPDHRHRADPRDVVRVRLAVEGRGGGGDDLLSDAGERGRGPGRCRPHRARPDAQLWGLMAADPACAQAAGRDAVSVQCAEDQRDRWR